MGTKGSRLCLITWCQFGAIPGVAKEQWQKIIPLHLTARMDTQHWGWTSHTHTMVENPQSWSFHGQHINVTIKTDRCRYSSVEAKKSFFPPSGLENSHETVKCVWMSPKSTQRMSTEQDGKECMFTWTTDHGQNDGKQQEWAEMAESLICAATTPARRVIFCMSVGFVRTVAPKCVF